MNKGVKEILEKRKKRNIVDQEGLVTKIRPKYKSSMNGSYQLKSFLPTRKRDSRYRMGL